MRCPHCGFNSFESAKFCAECGMPFEKKQKDPARYAKERKVVKLPSDASNRPSKPIERPWEVAVPQRGTSDDVTAAPKSDKGPTPRRRTQSAGTTGKIPPIKHPASETGKIPAEERKARAAAGVGGAPSAARTTGRDDAAKGTAPILIVDDAVSKDGDQTKAEAATPVIATAPAYASGSANARPGQSRRSAQRDTYSAQAKSTGKSKPIIITIAILIIVCLVALGVFLVNTNGSERTVSFDTDGGTIVGNQYILEDGKLDRPANPTRPGYAFDGWYLDAGLTEKAEFPIDVTQDMTLYAKWKQETTHSNGGVPGTVTTPGDATDGSTDTAAANGNSSSNSGSGSSASNGSQGTGSSRPNATKPSTGGSPSGNSGGASSSNGSSSNNGNLNGPGVSNGKVDIRLIASNGSALTGTVTLHDGYVIPDSSTKAYTVAELKALGLNYAELCIARNEPYARMGYSFRNPQLQAYFNARSWYHNTGWRGQLPEGSAGYVTAHNLLTIAKQSSGASKWLNLKMS